jgi:mRNA interferase MazF
VESTEPRVVSVRRGDIVFLRFPFSDGSGAKVRPAVIVQCDPDNSRLESTIVALITGNTRLVGREPGHLLIDVSTPEGRESGLRYNSVVNAHALFTLHTNQIFETVGRLSDLLMIQLDDRLREALALR